MKTSKRSCVRHAALLIGTSTILLTGCGKNSQQQAEKTEERFPGYEQVGTTGEAAQLRFSPSDIARSGSGYVIHVVKIFPQGYATFDVVTNCRDTTQRMKGTQYSNDGTAGSSYAGNDAPVQAKSEPGMIDLMTKACEKAMSARAILGPFSESAALELLYGPYDAKTMSASWSDAAVPPDLPWAENLQIKAGEDLLVTNVATLAYSADGKEKKVFVTNAVQENGGCHACTGLLGVAIFVKDGSQWKLESNEPYVASMGASGSVGGKFEWIPAGDNIYALVVSGGDMHQGIISVSTSVFALENGKFVPLPVDGAEAEAENEGIEVSTAFLKGKNPSHYDMKVTLSYTMPGQRRYIENHLYQYVGDKYVLVQKDDPPQFVKASDDDASASSKN